MINLTNFILKSKTQAGGRNTSTLYSIEFKCESKKYTVLYNLINFAEIPLKFTITYREVWVKC